MSWKPEQQNLRGLLLLLKDASDLNCRDHNVSNQRLLCFQQIPDYNAYLIHILTTMNPISIQLFAGNQLKNFIMKSFDQLPVYVLDYIKHCCYQYFMNLPKESEVNKMISCIIALVIRYGQVQNWLSIMSLLMENLHHTDLWVVKSSLDTLVMICKDVGQELDHLLNPLLSQLVAFYSHKDLYIRYQSLHATNQFILSKSIDQLNNVLDTIYTITIHEKEPCIRQEFCRIITGLFEAFPQHMDPYLDCTIEYMMNALNDENDDIKMSACTFWVQYADSHLYKQEHAKHLPRLMLYLLDLMTYSETELSDLHCLYHVSDLNKQHPTIISDKKQPPYIPEGSDLDDDDDSDDISDIIDEEFYSNDSLRKRSAQTLEVLSTALGSYITPTILDYLVHNKLVHPDWLVRESGILALGAAAEGGFMLIERHLNKLLPYLLNSLQDKEPLVRSISCWTTSRFSHWIAKSDYFQAVLFELLKRMLDSNTRVQESACTALIVLCEASQSCLIPYLYPILVHANKAFLVYGRRNRLMLYDALGTLADAVKSELNQPQFIYLLMPPLITKWNELSDNDTDLFPLLECLSNITVALGPGFIQYVDPVLSRCVKLISSTLQAQNLADQYQYAPPNVEVLIAALDLLSGIVQGLGPKIEPLFAQTNLVALLTQCVHDPVPEVLQSTFALVGDIAIASFDTLVPYLDHFFWGIIRTLRNDMMSVSVYNNGLWAAGEMVLRTKEAQPFATYLLESCIPLLTCPRSPPSVHENAMVAIGRVCLSCPRNAAPYLDLFIASWLKVSVREGEEKDSAFRGLCTAIKVNGTQKDLGLLLIAISNFGEPSVALSNDLRDVLQILKKEKNWEVVFSQLEKEPKKRISDLINS